MTEPTPRGGSSTGNEANAARPIDVVRARLQIVHARPPKFRARCPAHVSRGGTLAITEGRDGAVLLKCHAGCTTADVLAALGLTVRDLFAGNGVGRDRHDQRATARRPYNKSPREALSEALSRGVRELRERLRAELGYDRPLRGAELNVVRARACRELGLPSSALPPLRAFAWECAPHDDDPSWPALYSRALEECVAERWDKRQAAGAERWPHPRELIRSGLSSDPGGPTPEDHLDACDRAARWLHELAKESMP